MSCEFRSTSSSSSSSSADGEEGSSSTFSSRRSVCFSTIEFHEHAMVLGNNPSTMDGPSLELDWDIQDSQVVNIEEYETTRPPRRKRDQLQMPCFIREDVLLSSGYTRDDINEQVRCMEKERHDYLKSKKFSQKILAKTKKFIMGRKTSTV